MSAVHSLNLFSALSPPGRAYVSPILWTLYYSNAKKGSRKDGVLIFLIYRSIYLPSPVLCCGIFIFQVREVKEVIEQQNAEFPAAQLKLIHSGQILKDDSTLEEYQIKEDEFLVCMVTKVRRRSSDQACQP